MVKKKDVHRLIKELMNVQKTYNENSYMINVKSNKYDLS